MYIIRKILYFHLFMLDMHVKKTNTKTIYLSAHAFFSTFKSLDAVAYNLLDWRLFASCGALPNNDNLWFGIGVELEEILGEKSNFSISGKGTAPVGADAGYILIGHWDCNADLQYGKKLLFMYVGSHPFPFGRFFLWVCTILNIN